jgi:hypothetical protein
MYIYICTFLYIYVQLNVDIFLPNFLILFWHYGHGFVAHKAIILCPFGAGNMDQNFLQDCSKSLNFEAMLMKNEL